jgi:nitroreductase
MNFDEIAYKRQSCRNFDADKKVEKEKIEKIMQTALLSPSACNSQPYHFTVCEGETAHKVALATMGVGINKFTSDAPVLIVISESNYSKTAALGAKVKNNDYRSIDIGIAAAYITACATDIGLSTCILGWFDNSKIKEICSLKEDVRLVIALGYAKEDTLREKKRKPYSELVTELN